MKRKFLRRIWSRHSKIGRKRKKKQVWRKPKGRDNKMREKRRGYPVVVSVGYKTKRELSGKVNGKKPVIINNVKELGMLKENQVAIIGKVGEKKKIEIAKKAMEKNIFIKNLNPKSFIKKVESVKKIPEVSRGDKKWI